MNKGSICHKTLGPSCSQPNGLDRQGESAPNIARAGAVHAIITPRRTIKPNVARAGAVFSLLLLGSLLSFPAAAVGEQAQSGQLHYISIHGNDNPSIIESANYDNDDATGHYAIAIGAHASAENAYATSIGFDANATGDSGVALGHIAQASEQWGVAIGMFAHATDIASVALGSNSHTEPSVATTRIEIAGKEYSFAGDHPESTVSIGISDYFAAPDKGFTRTLVNLGAGRINKNSTDGVNGSQLFATNQALESLHGELQALQGGSVSYNTGDTVSPAGVHFFSVGKPRDGISPTVLGNYNNDGAKGYGSVAIGPDAKIDEGAESAVAIGGHTWKKYATALGNGSIAKHESSVALGYDSITEAVVATQGIDLARNHYKFAGDKPVATVSIGSNNIERENVYRTLTNVAAGRIDANSTDGINGSQLFAFQQAIENLDDQVSKASGDTKASSVWMLSTGSTPARIGDSGTVTFSGDNNIAVTQTGSDNQGKIDIALNRDIELDSVNVGDSLLRSDGLHIQGGPSVTVNGIDSGGKVITDVAPGALNTGSTDAVNGSQLFATNQKIDNVISQGISSGGLRIVQYSDPDTPTTPNGGKQTNDVTLVGGDSEQAVTIHNVAAGKNATDAVNVAQMNAMGDRIEKVDERASRGVASSMASAGLPQAYLPGKSMLAAATAHYRGEQALAIGASTISDNGKWVVKGAVNANRKDAGVSLGLGYQW